MLGGQLTRREEGIRYRDGATVKKIIQPPLACK